MRKLNQAVAVTLCVMSCIMFGNAAYAGGGGATEFTQKLNNSELIAQLEQIKEQVEMMHEMIDKLDKDILQFPNQIFRNVKGVYSSVKGIIDKGKGIAYNLSNIDSELKNRFKSYADLGKLSSAKDFSDEYKKIIETQEETVRSTMKAIGVQFEELEDDAAALEKIQGMAKSAEGEYQLQQATNQLLGFLAEDAFKLRQTMMEQSQVANTAYLEETAEKNLNQKKHEAFFAPDPEKSKFTHKLEKSALIGD